MKVTIGYEMDMRAYVDRPWRNEKRLLMFTRNNGFTCSLLAFATAARNGFF